MNDYLPWHHTGVNPERCDFTWLFKNQCAHCRPNHAQHGMTPAAYANMDSRGTE